MNRNALSWTLLLTLALVPAMAAGCEDDGIDDVGGGGGGGTGGGVGGGAGGGGGMTTDGGTTGACEDRVVGDNPATSPACATCICGNCTDELDACDATAGCQAEVVCAQTAIADGTCAGDISGAQCLIDTCGFGLADPSGAYLLCINAQCSTECVPSNP